ncbi:Nucleoside phosphatase [Handroanthus impetiginosus]|uniref:Nucleoside phosphatase n=1 Tax=Handroanthus impetiginosus TaxID=429701 RepID=A0A2G9I3F2_9LAMI|nr:Nucleoside phosphatase [Handroanthus impetiginosus]
MLKQNRIPSCLLLRLFIICICLSLRSPFTHALLTTTTTTATATGSGDDNYAVIFDAGSTGTRVHVFSFDQNLNLLPVGKDYEFFLSTTPGLSSYEDDPVAAALSIKPLLEEAEAVVPKDLRPKTPLRLGATAGLRQLSSNASEAILDAVRNFLKKESSLRYKAEWVSILEGTDEGAYQWVTINYLLGTLGKSYSRTVGVVDLGGGSVQMAYAISEKSAANAPGAPDGEDPYVIDKFVVGTKYHLYAHSYLNYGLKAARAQSLKLSGDHGNPCVTNGYQGTYKYSGVVYNVSAPASGTSMRRCRALTRRTLRIDAPCYYKNCSFNGIWNGGGGDGQRNLYVASFFYDTAAETGVVPPNAPEATVRPIHYKNAAKVACTANVDNIKSTFPLIDKRDVPFLCMDLIYEYTLLVEGFGVDPLHEISVLKQVKYKGSLLEAAWPLGCAVELLSSSSSSSSPLKSVA